MRGDRGTTDMELYLLQSKLSPEILLMSYCIDGCLTTQQVVAYHYGEVTFDELFEEANRNYQNGILASKA
jgi:hypothetical protein